MATEQSGKDFPPFLSLRSKRGVLRIFSLKFRLLDRLPPEIQALSAGTHCKVCNLQTVRMVRQEDLMRLICFAHFYIFNCFEITINGGLGQLASRRLAKRF